MLGDNYGGQVKLVSSPLGCEFLQYYLIFYSSITLIICTTDTKANILDVICSKEQRNKLDAV